MILVDANLLIYAHKPDMPQHDAAQKWLDTQLSGTTRVGLPWESLLAFVRLVTNPRVFEIAEPISVAWAQVEAWLTAPPTWIPAPTERHQGILARLMPMVTASNLVPDAQLAALAIEHGLTVQTSDAGFSRFPELRWENPITSRQAL